MGLDYVDVFYHHRPDPETPLEETMGALDQIVRSGKAIYAGVSNYPADGARAAADILKRLGTPFVLHQPKYSMLNRWIEADLLDVLRRRRRRVHPVFSAGAGTAHRSVSRGHPSRFARGQAARLPQGRTGHGRHAVHRGRTREACGGAWADTCPDGARMGTQAPRGHIGAHRREPGGTGRGRSRGAFDAELFCRRAAKDRLDPRGRRIETTHPDCLESRLRGRTGERGGKVRLPSLVAGRMSSL